MKLDLIVPESLKDITLEQMQSFQSVVDNHPEDEPLDFLHSKMIQIFCNIPLNIVNKIRKTDFDIIVSDLTEILNSKSKHQNTFWLDGVEYGFIPKLDDITAGEFADLDSYLGDFNNYHKAMAVMYRPVKKTVLNKLFKSKSKDYDIEEYKGSSEYSEIMKKAPMNVVSGAMVFFYNLRKELSISTMKYLKEELETLKTSGSEKNGDGISRSILSLEVIISELNKYQMNDYMKYYIS